MTIYVLNQSFEVEGVIDEYASIIWTTRYYTSGDFELYVGAKKELLDVLKVGNYLVRDKDIVSDGNYKNVMIISNREIKTDAENGDFFVITGHCLKSIFNRRVVINQTNLSGSVADGLAELVDENIINPSASARAISNFEHGTDALVDDTPTFTMQITGKRLDETFAEICQTYGYGYDVKIQNNKYVWYLYEGLDRSYSQDVNAYVVFSQDFDNLITCDYVENRDNYANVAVVAGEGEGTARKKETVGTATGLDRIEVWVDARNASSNNGQISDNEYRAMLQQDGKDALKEYGVTTSFEGEVNFLVTYELGVDYNLGDIVQIENDYGLKARARIIEIIESEDENGIKLVPTFSEMEVN